MKIIFDYNRTIFDPEKRELYEGVFELLGFLYTQHDLFLISQREEGRREVIKDLGIDYFFKKIVFVDQKSTEIFTELVKDSKDVLVVGDRLYGEISIGKELNYSTVWVKQGKFANQIPLIDSQKPKHEISNILELKEIIKQYE